jgi:hypothetical protein
MAMTATSSPSSIRAGAMVMVLSCGVLEGDDALDVFAGEDGRLLKLYRDAYVGGTGHDAGVSVTARIRAPVLYQLTASRS